MRVYITSKSETSHQNDVTMDVTGKAYSSNSEYRERDQYQMEVAC